MLFQIIYEVVGWENVILLVLRRVGSIYGHYFVGDAVRRIGFDTICQANS